MKRRPSEPRAGRTALRSTAEGRVAEIPGVSTAQVADATRLVHELQVHQVELELQNDELKSARAELEDGLARYTELFDFAPIGYVMLDAEGKLMALNHAAAALFGQERRLLYGSHFTGLLVDTDQLRFEVAVQRADEGDIRDRVELTLRRGKIVCVTIAVLSANQIMVALEDVTERRAAAERLATIEAALRLADTRKDEFLATLSHELRNPLTPVRNCLFLLTHYLQDRSETKREVTEAVAIMKRQVTHLARMIDDLLDVTRIGRGKVNLQKERTELNALVTRAVEDQKSTFDSAQLELDSVPAPAPVWLDADPTRLTQVLSNLLGNAEKFTPPGGRVTVRSAVRDDRVEISVCDSGSGIEADQIGSVFEPFAQAPQTMDRSRGGLGLGLSMVKGIIELHGGTVSISSAGANQGTHVTITLPISTSSQPLLTAADAAKVQSHRVLIIEDNEDAADTLCHALTVIGHNVSVAYDGSTGLQLAHDIVPDIVLCDIGLPEMDGYSVARRFREEQALRGVYLVALTGYARPEDLQQAKAAGFDEHVSKPASMERLNQIIARAPTAQAS